MLQPDGFNALIVEDDTLSGLQLNDLLEDHFPEVRVRGIAHTLSESRLLLDNHAVELLFLDIELPDGSGFDLLSAMPEVNFEVIVTTAHSHYALDAIRHSALDFLIKPVAQDELKQALTRFKKKLESWKTTLLQKASPPPCCRKLPLPTHEGFVFVDYDDIMHAEADRSYATFFLTNHQKIMVSKPLGDFEERLTSHNFIRVHKSHIINMNQVSLYVRGEGGYVVMSDQASIPVSRSRKDDFLEAIGSL